MYKVLDCQDEVGDKPSLNVTGSLLFIPGCTKVVCRPDKKFWVPSTHLFPLAPA
jgi:hypothetical protein